MFQLFGVCGLLGAASVDISCRVDGSGPFPFLFPSSFFLFSKNSNLAGLA